MIKIRVKSAKTLSTRRKEISVLRNAGLEDAYEKRAAYTDKTKADLKFAKTWLLSSWKISSYKS